MRTLALLLSVLALGALGLVACGGGDDDDEDTVATQATTTEEAAAGGGGATEIAMTEYKFDPADVTVGGRATITVTNDGQLPHNYTVEREGGAPLTTGDVDPGSSGEITLDLAPDEYKVICTIPGHAEQGMGGRLTVERRG
jgi:plastocyanin